MKRLDRVHHQLTNRQSVEVADLQLPEPEAIAQYLRLNDLYRAEPGNWLDEMTTDLSAELGLATAARRIGGIPFELPAGFFDQFSGEHIDPTRITSAGHTLVYLKGLGGMAAAAARREQLVGILLDRLERQAELFAAFLWKGARQLNRSAPWRRLHPSIALGLLWVWADRVSVQHRLLRCRHGKGRRDDAAARSLLISRTRFSKTGIPGWFRDYAVPHRRRGRRWGNGRRCSASRSTHGFARGPKNTHPDGRSAT